MAIKYRKTFPDIKIPKTGGQFSGLLTGLQTAVQQGQINEQSAMNRALLGIKMAELGAKTPKGEITKKDLFDVYNKERQDTRKEMLGLGYSPEDIDATNISFTDWISKNPDMAEMAGIKIPQPTPNINPNMGMVDQSMARVNAGDVAGIPAGAQPGMAIPGQGGIGQNLMGMAKQAFQPAVGMAKRAIGMGDPNVKAELDQLLASIPGLQGQPQGQPQEQPAGQEQTSDITTEDLLGAIDSETDLDSAIENIITLDDYFNQAGLSLGPDVDTDTVIQAFTKKFGKNALQKLMSRIQ